MTATLDQVAKKVGRGLGPERKVSPQPSAPRPGADVRARIRRGEEPRRVRIVGTTVSGHGQVLTPGQELDVESVGETGVGVLAPDDTVVGIPDGGYEVIAWHGDLDPCALHGEGSPKRVRVKRLVTVGDVSLQAGLEYQVLRAATGGRRGVIVRVGTDGEFPLLPEEFDVVERLPSPGGAADPGPSPAQGNGRKRRRAADDAIDFGDPPPMAPVASAEKAEHDTPIVRLEVDRLLRHPDNRRPTKADVDERAASMLEKGQLEPILVRAAPDRPGFHQIVSGETRWLAARKLGWPTIAGRVRRDLDDAAALELLAVANAARKDLDPIEKAQLIRRLCEPKDQGGAGLTREAAAKIYGLESGAAASNLVRLLELPKPWRDRVAAGELPQSFARLLTPYARMNRIMGAFESHWQAAHRAKASRWQREAWENRSEFEELVKRIVDDNTRGLGAAAVRRYAGHDLGDYTLGWGDFPPLFEMTDAVRKKLDVVTLTIDGEPTEVATNVKEFDRLQRPLVKRRLAEQRKKSAARSAGRDKPKSEQRDLTPAERKARAKQQAEQLAARIRGWRHEWLRRLCIRAIEFETAPAAAVVEKFVVALLLCDTASVRGDLARCTADALPKGADFGGGDLADAWRLLSRVAESGGKGAMIQTIVGGLCRLLGMEDRDVRYPRLPFGFVEGVAVELGVDLAEAWRLLQKNDRDRFEAFLLLHNAEQLDALAGEWSLFVEGKPKASKVQIILACAKSLPLPKSIKPLAPFAGGNRKRGRK